jgi:transcriptional regulator with GAF, ATPase, and Fis domain
MDLPVSLLGLARAVSWDGGDEIVRALQRILTDAAPFDLGELALSGPIGFRRWTLSDDDSAVVAEDLLLHVSARREAVRFDHPGDADPFPRTQALLGGHGLKSILALPLSAAGGPEGALVLGRRHGWAFVAASLHDLWPVASMAGLALERSIALTALRKEVEALRAQPKGPPAELEAARQELAATRRELEQVRRRLARRPEPKAGPATPKEPGTG